MFKPEIDETFSVQGQIVIILALGGGGLHRVSVTPPHSPSVPPPIWKNSLAPRLCKTGCRSKFAGAYFKLIFLVVKELTWVNECCFGRQYLIFLRQYGMVV